MVLGECKENQSAPFEMDWKQKKGEDFFIVCGLKNKTRVKLHIKQKQTFHNGVTWFKKKKKSLLCIIQGWVQSEWVRC